MKTNPSLMTKQKSYLAKINVPHNQVSGHLFAIQIWGQKHFDRNLDQEVEYSSMMKRRIRVYFNTEEEQSLFLLSFDNVETV